MFEKSIFCVVAPPAPSILIRFSNKNKKTLCPVTVLVDSQVSDVALGLLVFFYAILGASICEPIFVTHGSGKDKQFFECVRVLDNLDLRLQSKLTLRV